MISRDISRENPKREHCYQKENIIADHQSRQGPSGGRPLNAENDQFLTENETSPDRSHVFLGHSGGAYGPEKRAAMPYGLVMALQ